MSESRPESDTQQALAMERSISAAMRESLAADAERRKAEQAEREALRREPRPSQDSSRYNHGGGQAFYRPTVSQPPMELVSAVPELAELHAAWQAENVKGAELRAQLSAAENARIALFEGRDEDGSPKRRPGVRIDDVDDARLKVLDARRAAERQAARALAALKKFDDAAHEPELRPVRERLMAPVALEAHERLKAAWTELGKAVAARQDAYAKAGSPGRPWERRVYGPLTGTRQTAESYYEAMIDGFDVKAVEALAGQEKA
ncbi:hypothetical protein [Leifsonia sp. AG29]|uniref:hypothetical protein n=1 Tax=Leifsonia sp. AG29 TaxID=2598860 RepID=UPI00131CEDCE|nr:hypothetical protein [Leifsonia sp. AG29]